MTLTTDEKRRAGVFFALEMTKKTSEQDIEDMCVLLECIAKKYNFKWCQAFWSKKMIREQEINARGKP